MIDHRPTIPRFTSRAVWTATLSLLLAGCSTATANNGEFAVGGDAEERGSSNEIVSAELRDVEGQHGSAFAAVRNLRPRWLRVRSSNTLSTTAPVEPVVYLDEIRYGTLDTLYQINTASIESMRFVNSLNATTRYGTGHSGGVIELSSRSR